MKNGKLVANGKNGENYENDEILKMMKSLHIIAWFGVLFKINSTRIV